MENVWPLTIVPTRPEPHGVLTMSTRPGGAERWPAHLPFGAFRVGRSSARYDEAVRFYRDLVGLPVLDVDRR